ncbi:ATP-binding cassette domain-containing protein [Kocuria palustris]|uniref:ATP-binding cassette domain-containing protein n=1 Tax=Kocuria palustris TaxID=71999 RepID=UPI002407009E|nr:ATP-binding cassette domain-containing protein [Kocuria palustris]
MTRAVLHAHDLAQHYGSTAALGGVSLTIAPGESVAITGPSGSGKTTLLHALAGISVPDSGQGRLRTADSSVAVQELSAEERARLRREHFGFVFQQGLLLDERRDPVPLRLCRAPAGRAPVGDTTTPSPGCGLRMLYRALSAVGPCILGLPLVQLAGAAAKLSARRRDARLSGLRLLGAGRATLHALVLLEALLQAAIGLLAGLGIYAALIPALGGLHVDGVRIGAAALVLPWWAIALCVAALLGTAGPTAVAGLRRVSITPLAVRTRRDVLAMGTWRVILPALMVLAALFGGRAVLMIGGGEVIVDVIISAVMFGVPMLAMLLLNPWAISLSARRMHRSAQTPERLLAADAVGGAAGLRGRDRRRWPDRDRGGRQGARGRAPGRGHAHRRPADRAVRLLRRRLRGADRSGRSGR